MANLTLLDSSKNMQDPKEAYINYTYAMSTPLFGLIPWEAAPTGTKKWKVVDELAYTSDSEAYRKFEADYTATKVHTLPFSKNVVIAGGAVRFDRQLKNLAPQEIAIQNRAQIQAIGYNTTRGIFEGAGGDYIYGIKEYIDNESLFNTQSMNCGTASTGALLTTDLMDEFMTMWNLQAGKSFMFVSQKVALMLGKLARGTVSGNQNINYVPSEYGIMPQHYNGVPYIVLKDGKGSDILSTTDGDGASSTIYGVTFGEENFTGFQQGMVEQFEMKDKTSVQGFDLDWLINVAPQSRKCMARMLYVKEGLS